MQLGEQHDFVPSSVVHCWSNVSKVTAHAQSAFSELLQLQFVEPVAWCTPNTMTSTTEKASVADRIGQLSGAQQLQKWHLSRH